MFQRWVIRGLALTLLTLCVAVWVGSYYQRVMVDHYRNYHSSTLEVGWGKIGFMDSDVDLPQGAAIPKGWVPPTWVWQRTPASPHGYYELMEHRWRFLGFAYFWDDRSHQNLWGMHVPLWFPTALGALLLWRAWRMARATAGRRAFPVEIARAKGAER